MLFAITRSHRLETSLHMLVEHLDSALGVGEALMSCTYEPTEIGAGTTPVQILDALEDLRAFVEDVRGLEMALSTKVRQARHWGQRLGRLDQRCGTAGRLYHAGTQAFVDAMPGMADRTGEVFENGDQALVYLRDRNLIGPDQLSLDGIRELAVGPDFLVYGWAPLGDLMDLTGRFLSAVETEHFVAVASDSVTPLPAETADAAPLLSRATMEPQQPAASASRGAGVEGSPEAAVGNDEMAPWLAGQQAEAPEATAGADEMTERDEDSEGDDATVEAVAAEEDGGTEAPEAAAATIQADRRPDIDENTDACGDGDSAEAPLELSGPIAADGISEDAAVSAEYAGEHDVAGEIGAADAEAAGEQDDERPEVGGDGTRPEALETVEPGHPEHAEQGEAEARDGVEAVDADDREPHDDEGDLAAPVPVMTLHQPDPSLEKV